jgi:hypothetical protein
MPFQSGKRLPGERASKIGHLEVLDNPLVQSLCKQLKDRHPDPAATGGLWSGVAIGAEPLSIVFSADGSYQVIENEMPPYCARAFIKTALLRLDQYALKQIDKETPHPFALRDILKDSAMHHATVFPLRNVEVAGKTLYHAVREIIFTSLKDDPVLESQPYETLKWLAYHKWNPAAQRQLPDFECPHCHWKNATLPYDADTGDCHNCGGKMFLTDMLGFHQEMAEESAPDTVASSYMAIHETLMLFTGIRYFWEGNRQILRNCLFIKDGPLSIRAQYSKLVPPIRTFIEHANASGCRVHIIGQEKSGTFFDHLLLIRDHAPHPACFIPNDAYIKEQIQNRPNQGAPYGLDTNYGAKVFLKLNPYHSMVINVPTGQHRPNPTAADLIGFDRILATLPTILSNRYEGALMPVEMANGVASLSTYPSARILKMFAERPDVHS